MKTLINKLAVTIIPLVAISALVMCSTGIAKKAERLQTSAITSSQPGSELFSARYNDVMSNLYFASGR